MPAQTGPLPAISFEFFPAKSEKAAATLLENAKTLAAFGPQFMSVTYGAGGSTRDRTLATLKDMVRETGAPMAGHLTCVGASKEDVYPTAPAHWDPGGKHSVAPRGGPAPRAARAGRSRRRRGPGRSSRSRPSPPPATGCARRRRRRGRGHSARHAGDCPPGRSSRRHSGRRWSRRSSPPGRR